jgi:hypothetical protein
MEAKITSLSWQLSAKSLVPLEHHDASRHLNPRCVTAQPVTNCANRVSRLVVVSAYVLPRYIGAEVPVSILVSVENQAPLLRVPFGPVPLRAEEEAQFERHVEPGELRGLVDACTRNIVNAEPRVLDDVENLVDASLTAILNFQSGTSREPAVVYRENKCIEDALVFAVERNVEENAILVRRHPLPLLRTPGRGGAPLGRAVAMLVCAYGIDDHETTGRRVTVDDARSRCRGTG